jgi:3,4-dihydroxy 2-butanone 4-phosphate synthase / GTP cyclohydrolase II
VSSLRLLTNNPAKVAGLAGFGIKVTGRVPMPVAPTPDNLRYLIAKRDRLGHQIDGLQTDGVQTHGVQAGGVQAGGVLPEAR